MGYTIATPIRDDGSKARMLAFLEKNFRHWSEIACEEKDAPRYYHGPVPDGELDYDRGACRIGFNFHTSGYDREYIFTVCRWMALKCGREDYFDMVKYPVIVYDGEEGQVYEDEDEEVRGRFDPAWPVIVVEPGHDLHEGTTWCAVDRWGCLDFTGVNVPDRTLHRERLMVQDWGFDGREVIREEMKRLDELWKREAP